MESYGGKARFSKIKNYRKCRMNIEYYRKIHCLTREFLVEFHETNDIARCCVVAVDLNLIRWLVDLATKLLSCARKHTRKPNLNTQVCEVHPFHTLLFETTQCLEFSFIIDCKYEKKIHISSVILT